MLFFSPLIYMCVFDSSLARVQSYPALGFDVVPSNDVGYRDCQSYNVFKMALFFREMLF